MYHEEEVTVTLTVKTSGKPGKYYYSVEVAGIGVVFGTDASATEANAMQAGIVAARKWVRDNC